MRLLNWLYGARLARPDGETVEIQPIGRGITHAWVRLEVVYSKFVGMVDLEMNKRLSNEMKEAR